MEILPENKSNATITGFFIGAIEIVFLLTYMLTVQPEIENKSDLVPTGTKLVYIKNGWFNMGSVNGYVDEEPEHLVYLEDYYMEETEVSNGQYKLFCDTTNRTYPPAPANVPDYFIEHHDYPVVNVSWEDASNYCKWLGRRLPTEAEWEYAAQGGIKDLNFSFGDVWKKNLVNSKEYKNDEKQVEFEGKNGPMPVKSFQKNILGIYNLTGNVSEWVYDWYDKQYYVYSPERQPQGPDNGEEKVVRGGSWSDRAMKQRVQYRASLHPYGKYYNNVGFRCVADKKRPSRKKDESINAKEIEESQKEAITKEEVIESTYK